MFFEKDTENNFNAINDFERLIDNAIKNLNGIGEDFKLLLDLADAARKTLDENIHLTDGDVCTLRALRDAYLKIDPDWMKNKESNDE